MSLTCPQQDFFEHDRTVGKLGIVRTPVKIQQFLPVLLTSAEKKAPRTIVPFCLRRCLGALPSYLAVNPLIASGWTKPKWDEPPPFGESQTPLNGWLVVSTCFNLPLWNSPKMFQRNQSGGDDWWVYEIGWIMVNPTSLSLSSSACWNRIPVDPSRKNTPSISAKLRPFLGHPKIMLLRWWKPMIPMGTRPGNFSHSELENGP